MKINDVFVSIQGEGACAGTPAIFIRLAGCNLTCPFCDTQFHKTSTIPPIILARLISEEYTIVSKKTGAKFGNLPMPLTIVWTGGEPTLQQEKIYQVIAALQKRFPDKYRHHIESNGTIHITRPEAFEHITISPKGDISKLAEVKSEYMEISVGLCNLELKFVAGQSPAEVMFWIKKLGLQDIPHSIMRITAPDETPEITIAKDRVFIQDCIENDIRFCPRLHKIYDLK